MTPGTIAPLIGGSRHLVVLLAAAAVAVAALLPASGAAGPPKKWRGTVLISAKYEAYPNFEDQKDYLTYNAKAVFDGRRKGRITWLGKMTWTWDAGTRTGDTKNYPCTWNGSGTTPVIAEIYKADPEDGTRNLAVRLFLQHQPKFGSVTESCWGWDTGSQTYGWLRREVDAWEAVRGLPGTSLALPVKSTRFKRTLRVWFPFSDNPRATRATVVATFALK